MKKILLVLACVVFASMAQAVTVYNGDFEIADGAGVDVNLLDVTGWYDNIVGNFWDNAWQSNANWITAGGNYLVVFSSNASSVFGAPSTNPDDGCYIYQSIGTADGQSTLMIQNLLMQAPAHSTA